MRSLCRNSPTTIYLIASVMFIYIANTVGMDISRKIEHSYNLNIKPIKDMLRLTAVKGQDTIQNALKESRQDVDEENEFGIKVRTFQENMQLPKLQETLKGHKLKDKRLDMDIKQENEFINKIRNDFVTSRKNILHVHELMDTSLINEKLTNKKKAATQRLEPHRITEMHLELLCKLMKMKAFKKKLIHEIDTKNNEFNLEDSKYGSRNRKKRATYLYKQANYNWTSNTNNLYGINLKNGYSTNNAFSSNFGTIDSSSNVTPVYGTKGYSPTQNSQPYDPIKTYNSNYYSNTYDYTSTTEASYNTLNYDYKGYSLPTQNPQSYNPINTYNSNYRNILEYATTTEISPNTLNYSHYGEIKSYSYPSYSLQSQYLNSGSNTTSNFRSIYPGYNNSYLYNLDNVQNIKTAYNSTVQYAANGYNKDFYNNYQNNGYYSKNLGNNNQNLANYYLNPDTYNNQYSDSYSQNRGSYNQNPGNYYQNPDAYNQNIGNNNKNLGIYNQNYGYYNQTAYAYDQNIGTYNQNVAVSNGTLGYYSQNPNKYVQDLNYAASNGYYNQNTPYYTNFGNASVDFSLDFKRIDGFESSTLASTTDMTIATALVFGSPCSSGYLKILGICRKKS